MSHFNPVVALNIISNSLPLTERQGFCAKWNDEVNKQVSGWKRSGSSIPEPQLIYASQACQYAKYLYDKTLKNGKFSLDLPLYGPRFSPPPPAFLHRKPSASSQISPGDFYLKPVTLVHELFWPSLLTCPTCAKAGRGKGRLERQGYTPEGPRTVHGIYEDEYVIGNRIRCKTCTELKGGGRIQWSFTAQEFWSDMPYWEIPREIPHFFQRTAISRDLFNLINEVRLSVPAGRLHEHIFQLHLLEYHQRRLQYLKLVSEALASTKSATKQSCLDTFFVAPTWVIEPFSEPLNAQGYNLTSISDDMIFSVYQHFANTRTRESEELIRGITCKVLSFDATYKATKKATISTTKKGTRQKPFETLVTMITEDNLVASWRFNFTEAMLEVQDQLRDLRERFKELGAPPPCQVVVDNCCTVRNKVQEVLPQAVVGLDVYHYCIRYTRTLKTSHAHLTSALGSEIVSALLSETAVTSTNGRAQYRKKEDQARLMEVCFQKWKQRGAFTSAVDAVHEMGMKHIQKGCLERCVADVRSDGSRIENTNRGWNGIARAIPGGLEGFLNQAHDWVLRRNIRLASDSKAVTSISRFVSTTFGSHHISLISKCTQLWNVIIEARKLSYPLLPTLQSAQTDEHFGLVRPIDGTFGVKSTEDIDYCGFEETLLFEDVVKQEFADLDDLDSLGDDENQVGCGNSNSVPGVSSHSPVGPSQRKRSHPSDASNQDGIAKRSKRRRPLLSSDELDSPEDVTMELIPDGQALEDYLQTEPAMMGSTALPSVVPVHNTEHQPPTPVYTSSRPIPFTFLPPLNTPSPSVVQKPQHPFFNRFPNGSTTSDPVVSRQPTPLITPRVLPRQSSRTTRHASNVSTPGTPATQPAPTATLANPERGKTLKAAAHPILPQTTLPAASSATLKPLAVAVPSKPQLIAPMSQHDQVFHNGPGQQVFHRLARLDPQALKFQDGDFLVMMDLRAERKWDSRRMGRKEWEDAVQLFNTRRQGNQPTRNMVPIQGKIFQDEFLKAERAISQRLLTSDFQARSSGTETFWRKHCFAVPGFGPGESGSPASDHVGQGLAGSSGSAGPSDIKGKGKAKANRDGAERKQQVCRRCRQTKYPGGKTNKGINHKKSECSDGISPSLKDIPYPLHSGIIRETKLDVDNFRRHCLIIQEKQVKCQLLSREEENLLAYYSENMVEGSDGATFFAF
ncbi:hypothetical protein FS837_003829, partial [Tulasnella sp. UAMH 9824]